MLAKHSWYKHLYFLRHLMTFVELGLFVTWTVLKYLSVNVLSITPQKTRVLEIYSLADMAETLKVSCDLIIM